MQVRPRQLLAAIVMVVSAIAHVLAPNGLSLKEPGRWGCPPVGVISLSPGAFAA
jgi:hypothetical protein